MSGVKRKQLSVSDKINVIHELERGLSNSDVSRKHGLSSSTVSTIWKNREKLTGAFEKNHTQAKKLRLCDKGDLDTALLSWFKVKRSENVPISGPVLKVQAEKFAANLGYLDFVCCNGWLDRFKNRHQIVFSKISGEANSVDTSIVSSWVNDKWQLIKSGYNEEDIFNADETGLFYKLSPDKTFKFKGEKCIGGKQSKVRLTVLLCSNSTGTEKRKLLVIGKSRKPRCFSNVKKLPVDYEANSKAWMTSMIFEQEIRKWDLELRKNNRKILLLVDNCPAHPSLQNLKNINLVFLPPNTTAKLQPMDQGVIRSFKVHYRRLMILKIIENMEEKKIHLQMTVLDAIRFMKRAWSNVSQTTIRNSFKKSGLIPRHSSTEDYHDDDDIPLSEWIKTLNSTKISTFEKYSIDDYETADDDVHTSEIPTDEDIIADVTHCQAGDSEAESEGEDELSALPVVSVNDARDCFKKLTEFSEINNVSDEFLEYLNKLQNCFDEYRFKTIKQTKINDYFKVS